GEDPGHALPESLQLGHRPILAPASPACAGEAVADMDRPCRDGADRAERQDRRPTSSFSWRPSSSSPSCHPPSAAAASRGWWISAGILGEPPETCQGENTTCGVIRPSSTLDLGADDPLRSSRERTRADDAHGVARTLG